MTSQLDDTRMEELFAAFGDAHATDRAKARVLDAIPSERVDVRVVGGRALADSPTSNGERTRAASSGQPRRWMRVARFAAAVACFAALAVGGVAYAIPTSSVTVTAGDGAVDLGVNCFGITVSATSESAEVQQAVDGAQVRNLPYDESLGRAIDSLEAANPEPVQVDVRSADEHARSQMEERAEEVVDERAPAKRDEATTSGSPERHDSVSANASEEGLPAEKPGDASDGEPLDQQPPEGSGEKGVRPQGSQPPQQCQEVSDEGGALPDKPERDV